MSTCHQAGSQESSSSIPQFGISQPISPPRPIVIIPRNLWDKTVLVQKENDPSNRIMYSPPPTNKTQNSSAAEHPNLQPTTSQSCNPIISSQPEPISTSTAGRNEVGEISGPTHIPTTDQPTKPPRSKQRFIFFPSPHKQYK